MVLQSPATVVGLVQVEGWFARSPAGAGEDLNGSQFYITLGDNLYSLDEKHTIFGEVAEGLEVLEALSEAPCDDAGRPLQNIRWVVPAGAAGRLRQDGWGAGSRWRP